MDQELPEEWRLALGPAKPGILEDIRRRIFTHCLPGLGIHPVSGEEWDYVEQQEKVSAFESARRAIILGFIRTFLLEGAETNKIESIQRKHRNRRRDACPAQPTDYETPSPVALQKQLEEYYLAKWHRYEHIEKLPVDLLYAARRGESVFAPVTYIDDGTLSTDNRLDFQHRKRADIELYSVSVEEVNSEEREIFLDPEIYTDGKRIVIVRVYSDVQPGNEYFFDALTGERCAKPLPRDLAEINALPSRRELYRERLKQERDKRVSKQVRAIIEQLLRESSSLEDAEKERARISRVVLEARDLRQAVTSRYSSAIWAEAHQRAIKEKGPAATQEAILACRGDLLREVVAEYIDRGLAEPSLRVTTSALETQFHPADYSLVWRELPWRMSTALLPSSVHMRLTESLLYSDTREDRASFGRTEEDLIQDPDLQKARVAYALQRIALSIQGKAETDTYSVPVDLVTAALLLREKLLQDAESHLVAVPTNQKTSRRFDLFCDILIKQYYELMHRLLNGESVDLLVQGVEQYTRADVQEDFESVPNNVFHGPWGREDG